MQKLKQLQIDVAASTATSWYQFKNNPTKKQKVFAAIYGMLLALFAFMQTSFAATNFFTQLGTMMSTIYSWILGISSGLAIVLIAVGIIRYMAAIDPQSAKNATGMIKRVIVAWICINLLGALATVIQKLTEGNNFAGGKSNYTGWS